MFEIPHGVPASSFNHIQRCLFLIMSVTFPRLNNMSNTRSDN